ncbi:MAG: hypothetical protein COA82_01750 [Alkaliphilus sp.]|nr:MAG: hypothetical protein COA82_01750 [Alkaliphilus sp.]
MYNKKIIYVLTIVSGIILLIALGAGFYVSTEINKTSEALSLYRDNKEAGYHIMMFLDKSNQMYSDAFRAGVNEVAKEHNIAVELISIDRSNYIEELLDRLDLAMYAKVDGIIVHAYLDERIIGKIEQAKDMGIPVVTLNEDLPLRSRITYVGINRYNMGLVVGETIAKKTGGSGKLAVIEQKGFLRKGEQNITKKTDLMIQGINDVFERYDDLSLEVVRYIERGVLRAGTVATEILQEYPSINAIYSTDGQSTLGIVQVLIDNNRVKDFVLVSFGDNEGVLHYIGKGDIIEATIVTDYKEIGKSAVRAFYEYKTTGVAKSHVNVPMQVVDENNVESYMKEKSEAYEKNE